MLPLEEALAQISDIRGHLARTETFRGYRSATVGFTAVVAMVTAAIQPTLIVNPTHSATQYPILWIAAAIVSLSVSVIEMSIRCARATSALTVERTRQAAEQFAPCLLAGALLTCVLVRYASESLWMLPGLWSILFSLGVFASARLLPRAAIWVAVYYLAAGTFCLALAQGDHALSPWTMGGTFGVGQTLAATILYYTLERRHDQK